MMKHLRAISSWGITAETPTSFVEHYRLANLILLFMFVMSTLQTILCFSTGAFTSGLINATAPLAFGGGLLLMRSGHTVIARVGVFAMASTLGHEFLASVGPDSGFQYIFLFASALAIGMFSTREKPLLAFGIVAPLACLMSLELSGYKPFLVHPDPISAADLKILRLSSLMSVWLMMVLYFLYFIIDRHRSQMKLIESAKMVALGRMAAGVAHEINNPLQVIMSNAEVIKLAAKNGQHEQVISKADHIQSVSMRIASINKGLLALARDAKGDPFDDVSICEVIRLSLEFCRARFEAKKIEIQFGDEMAKRVVKGRESQLAEVILNIMNNAYDAVEGRDASWVRIEVLGQGSWVEIVISDSGPGIDKNIVPRIFDPFFTTKPAGRGTGLGLSICKAVVTDHEGEIYYDTSRPHSTFVLRLRDASSVA